MGCVIVYSCIEVHKVSKRDEIIDQDTPIDGSRLEQRARIENDLSQDNRVANAGPRAVQATILSLAGLIYSRDDEGVRCELREFLTKGL